jgi:peptidoglycan/xylan/chitin deacetylase (PgdA/CDA1 family)
MIKLSRMIAAGLLTLVVACGAETAAPPPPSASVTAPATTSSATPDPVAVAANELGQVPVLMYHRIVAGPKSVYDRTPADFRAELERLAAEQYVAVTAADYTAGKIDIPAGTHPVVLTFDDGDPSQLTLTAESEPAADTAVAILRDVAARHPQFRAVATFYVNADPFGDPGGKRTLPWLRDHGMEIGNHTLTHANLRQADPQREIAQGDAAIRQAGPGLEPVTLALPFGVHPRDAALALTGSSAGTAYHYRGVFLVGANPAPSPYADGFDPLRIPRIRSQGPTGTDAKFASTVWLDKLAATPAQRYTSDGVPTQIAYPRTTGQSVAVAYKTNARPY